MTHYPNLTRLLSLGVVSAAAFCGCLDFTPITVAPSDAGAQDAPIVTIGANFDAGACEPCVQGPSCSAALATCAATAKCMVMFQCGLEQGCYTPQVDLVACLTICGQQAGLTGESDPAVAPFLALYECATSKCSASCGGN
jgi:hypothetical protein